MKAENRKSMVASPSDLGSDEPIVAQRHEIRPLLVPHDPGDARTAYYALRYSAQRTSIALHRSESGQVNGFLATCITGANPFQPLVVLRAYGPGTLEGLVRDALTPGRSYLFSVPIHVGAALGQIASADGLILGVSDIVVWRILRTNSSHFSPLINVLVVRARGPGGQPRWEIQTENRVVSAAGVNWQDGHWAEVYVDADATARARRWDDSVLAAATSALLADGVTPLYMVRDEDKRDRQQAEARGYVDSGARELTCVVTVPRSRSEPQGV